MHSESRPLIFASVRMRPSLSSTSMSARKPVHAYHRRKSSKERSVVPCGTNLSQEFSNCWEWPASMRCLAQLSSGTCRSIKLSITFATSPKSKRPDLSTSCSSKISLASITFSRVMLISRASLCSCQRGTPDARCALKSTLHLKDISSVSQELCMSRKVARFLPRKGLPGRVIDGRTLLLGATVASELMDMLRSGGLWGLLGLICGIGCHAAALLAATFAANSASADSAACCMACCAAPALSRAAWPPC
mmetsp:Transcript_24045/g.56981  ORF Transcript_24045/g.56981 Transcript_24045/m.56981 type:complete len:249 (+) Transcript_24045:403-1149(+)